MNFAVIGLGSFGIKRAQAIKNSKLAKLIYIFDINETNAKKASEDLKVPIKSYNEILNNKEIDVVCVCTPNKFHKDIIIDSLNNGKHVFCEKPYVRNVDEAKEILDVTKKSKGVLQLASNHRFFESVIYARKLVDEGTVGKVLSFNGRIGHNGERLKDSWFWKKEISGGGTLLDNGCHLLDLSRVFVGNFTSGKGLISNAFWKNIEVEDTASGIFKTDDDRTATIYCSWRLLSGYFFFEINGSDGYINVDGRFDTHGGDKIFWSNIKEKKVYSKDFSHIKPNSYLLEIENFISNLKNSRKISPSAEDGLEIMKMIEFIYSK
jgi:predicted dehydrogenase|tara:strand:+ start:1328 stop:2290 length:963 start_codon:yes stop_codon:yes gene_type:complete